MSRFKGGPFLIPTASQFVQSALRYVGYARNKTGLPTQSFYDL